MENKKIKAEAAYVYNNICNAIKWSANEIKSLNDAQWRVDIAVYYNGSTTARLKYNDTDTSWRYSRVFGEEDNNRAIDSITLYNNEIRNANTDNILELIQAKLSMFNYAYGPENPFAFLDQFIKNVVDNVCVAIDKLNKWKENIKSDEYWTAALYYYSDFAVEGEVNYPSDHVLFDCSMSRKYTAYDILNNMYGHSSDSMRSSSVLLNKKRATRVDLFKKRQKKYSEKEVNRVAHKLIVDLIK